MLLLAGDFVGASHGACRAQADAQWAFYRHDARLTARSLAEFSLKTLTFTYRDDRVVISCFNWFFVRLEEVWGGAQPPIPVWAMGRFPLDK
jgi:hypothetical protein